MRRPSKVNYSKIEDPNDVAKAEFMLDLLSAVSDLPPNDVFQYRLRRPKCFVLLDMAKYREELESKAADEHDIQKRMDEIALEDTDSEVDEKIYLKTKDESQAEVAQRLMSAHVMSWQSTIGQAIFPDGIMSPEFQNNYKIHISTQGIKMAIEEDWDSVKSLVMPGTEATWLSKRLLAKTQDPVLLADFMKRCTELTVGNEY